MGTTGTAMPDQGEQDPLSRIATNRQREREQQGREQVCERSAEPSQRIVSRCSHQRRY